MTGSQTQVTEVAHALWRLFHHEKEEILRFKPRQIAWHWHSSYRNGIDGFFRNFYLHSCQWTIYKTIIVLKTPIKRWIIQNIAPVFICWAVACRSDAQIIALRCIHEIETPRYYIYLFWNIFGIQSINYS
jgi:hypothetical protein